MILLLTMYILMPHVVWAQQNIENSIYLSPQANTTLPAIPGLRIKVRGKKILQIEDLGNKIQITALHEGDAQIIMGAKIFSVHVVNKEKINFFNAATLRLKNFLDLRAEIQNGEVTVVGNLHRLSDWKIIVELAREYNVNFLLRARLDADVKEAAKNWLNEMLRAQNLTMPHLIFEPTLVAVLSEEEKQISTLWQQALGPLGVQAQYEKSQLSTQPLVRVRIVVAEVNKKIQSQLGVEWPNMISATVSPKLSGPNSLEIFLKAMEQNGLGQILASPNLLARSGSEADFLAGGEFGIKINTSKTKEVVWKRHGIYLKIKPLADRSGRLSVELSTEISLVDASQSIDGIPALKTNRMSTHFDLSQPRTIVLSGLIRQDWGRSHNEIMGLSKIPVIGALFRSNDFFDNKTELVIFVTPEIVNDRENFDSPLLPKSWMHHD